MQAQADNDDQKLIDQAIALAGLSQSIRVVQHIAWKGQTNDTDFRSVIGSLLRIDAPSAAAIYGGSFEVSSGLRTLSHQLDPRHPDKDPEFVNIAINVIALQRQLQGSPKLLALLGEKIDALAQEFAGDGFYSDDETFERLLERCSEIYKATLSQLPNRIQIKGDPKNLKRATHQIRIRAALLAAIRGCFLWRQSGGTRWHFLFKKKSILRAVQQLINMPVRE